MGGYLGDGIQWACQGEDVCPHSQFNKGSSILDSGTTDIYLPAVVFNEVKKLLYKTCRWVLC